MRVHADPISFELEKELSEDDINLLCWMLSHVLTCTPYRPLTKVAAITATCIRTLVMHTHADFIDFDFEILSKTGFP